MKKIILTSCLLIAAASAVAAQEGLGADVSSIGELYTAVNAGFPSEKIHKNHSGAGAHPFGRASY